MALIEREALLAKIWRYVDGTFNGMCSGELRIEYGPGGVVAAKTSVAHDIFCVCKSLVEKAPTIDPIKAAGGCRCGECKHYDPDIGVKCTSLYGLTEPDEDEFCSYGEPREARTMAECIYKTYDGHCTKHSDNIEFREPCVRMDGPCDDETLPEPPKENGKKAPT